MGPADADYVRLLTLRTGLRRFERWSEQQAREAGLTPAQHQLLLAVRGHPGPQGPTIGEVADYLLLRHHSVVGLVDRAEAAGLVERDRTAEDHRVVRLRLSADGAARLAELSALHLEELDRLARDLPAVGQGLAPAAPHGGRPTPTPAPAPARPAGVAGVEVDVARVYDHPGPERGHRVLVDRLWPRGTTHELAPFDVWTKTVAPSTELRTWYGHVPARFEEFADRYRAELADGPAAEALAELRARAEKGPVVLVTATKDVEHSAATVLRTVLAAG